MKGSDILPNPNTLSYLHYQDIQIPDIQVRKQFQYYWNTYQYSEAINYITFSGLSGKAYLANVINTITNGISYLEGQYNTDVPQFLEAGLTHFNFLIDSFKMRYVWNQSVSYVLFNFVTYNGETYMALGDVPVGTLPTDTTYWLQLSLKGDRGSPGVNVRLRYNWESGTQYAVNDVVTYDGQMYAAKVENTNVIPGTDDNTWILFIGFPAASIAVGTTAPTVPFNNDLWLATADDPNTVTETTAVLKRYDGATSAWVDMYPLTASQLIDGVGTLPPPLAELDYTITTDQWSNMTFTYGNDMIKADSVVRVLLDATATSAQRTAYNKLSIAVSTGQFVLTSPVAVTVSLPLIILIQ